MLYSIKVENFYSIGDRQELIFKIPANAPGLPCFRTSAANKNTRLPLVLGFFGPNASGKTTILRAITSAVLFASKSFNFNENFINLLFQPYRKKNWWGKPTRITLEFDGKIDEDKLPILFRYELHISHKANNFGNKAVSYEALSYAPKEKFCRLFERKEQIFRFGSEFDISKNNDPRKESIRSDASVISVLAKLNHKMAKEIVLILQTFITNIIGVNKIEQNNINNLLSKCEQNETFLKRLNIDLKRFDVGIESMLIEKTNLGLMAKFKHSGLDEFIHLAEESKGTQRFINIFPLLYHVLEVGGVAIIDELDTDLHPILLPEIFRWFKDPLRNPRGAQLFFTAHNATLLDDLEKEQVFFTEMLTGQPSKIYGAGNIKGLRREPSLMKKYLSGELGAVPHIG